MAAISVLPSLDQGLEIVSAKPIGARPQPVGRLFKQAQAQTKDLTPGFHLNPQTNDAKAPSNDDKSLLATLRNSKVFDEFQRAFSSATGLPLALRPVEAWDLPLHAKPNESPYCALMSEKGCTSGPCMHIQDELARTATHEPQTVVCPAGLYETLVPVRLGERLIGFLQTGQVFRRKPTKARFERVLAYLSKLGLPVHREKWERAYITTNVMRASKHEATITLLTIFAQHLSILSNEVLVRHANAEPPAIGRARQYIEEHMNEDLTLAAVAKVSHMSTYYFCKSFKKVVGLNFTVYLSRVRLEKAKTLLLNPHLRISEIAFEVGFQSLTHFNRRFREILGQSPTDYRARLKVRPA